MTGSVAFDPLNRDQDPLDFHLKVREPTASPKVETAEDKELSKLAEDAKSLEREFSDALANCKTDAERAALGQHKFPANLLASRFLRLAKAHPDHPVAIGALAYVFQTAASIGNANWPISKVREQAIDQVIERHLENPDVVLFLSVLQFGAPSPNAEALLCAAGARSPHREVQAAAYYELARFLLYAATVPEILKSIESTPVPKDSQSLLALETRLAMMRRLGAVDSARRAPRPNSCWSE